MNLPDYRRRFGVTYAHIARQCNVSAAAIAITAGGRKPSFELAVKIERATHGKVPRDNWYPPRPADISITIGDLSA